MVSLPNHEVGRSGRVRATTSSFGRLRMRSTAGYEVSAVGG